MSKARRRPVVRHALVQVGSRILSPAESAEILAQVSASLRERGERERLSRRAARIESLPIHRRSVERAMLAVEERLVKAYWVLARSTSNPSPREPNRNGIGYLHEKSDQDARYKDAAAQNWESVSPAPPVPSGRDIDEADKALDWLLLLGTVEARIVASGARSKRGDARRRVNWMRVRLQIPEYSGWSASKLRRTYYSGLRNIAAEVRL